MHREWVLQHFKWSASSLPCSHMCAIHRVTENFAVRAPASCIRGKFSEPLKHSLLLVFFWVTNSRFADDSFFRVRFWTWTKNIIHWEFSLALLELNKVCIFFSFFCSEICQMQFLASSAKSRHMHFISHQSALYNILQTFRKK